MCLIINNNHHPEKYSRFVPKPIKNDEADIQVLKLVFVDGSKYETGIRKHGFSFVNGIAELTIDTEHFSYLLEASAVVVEHGIHSYTFNEFKPDDNGMPIISKRIPNTTMESRFLIAVIPKGTEYYVGCSDDTVSKKLLVFKTFSDYEKYTQGHKVIENFGNFERGKIKYAFNR